MEPDQIPLIRRPLFWVLAVPLAAGSLWLALLLALGTTGPLEATAGRSMEPSLHTGDLAVLRGTTPDQLRLGDVVALRVHPLDQAEHHYPPTILHRVIDISMADGRLMVQTQGDNLGAPDPFLTPASEVDRRMVASIPLLGWLLFFLKSQQGLILIGGLLALFLLYELISWATYTAEEIMEPDPESDPVASGFRELALAIDEYGEHLRSHTRVVRELGGTTEELHGATAMQREVLGGLQQAVQDLAGAARGLPGSPRPGTPPPSPNMPPPRVEPTRVVPPRVPPPSVAPPRPPAPSATVRLLPTGTRDVLAVDAPASLGSLRLIELGIALEHLALGEVALYVEPPLARYLLRPLDPASFTERLEATGGVLVAGRLSQR